MVPSTTPDSLARHVLCTLTVFALLGCSSTGPGLPDPALRVLFIGNSLTYTHDIPGLVSGLGETTGESRLDVSAVAYGGYSLEDHWNRGDALDSIARGGWDFVVLQQGPSTLASSRAHLVEWSSRFAERIRQVGARPAIYMVWPSNGDYDAVSRAYTDAAVAVDGMLIPAGEAFRAVARDHPDIGIFGSDGFHPSAAGSYLAALVIYGQVTGRVVRDVSHQRTAPGLAPAQVAQLGIAADEANRDFGID